MCLKPEFSMTIPTAKSLPEGWRIVTKPYTENQTAALNEDARAMVKSNQFAEADVMIYKRDKTRSYVAVRAQKPKQLVQDVRTYTKERVQGGKRRVA